MAQFEYKGSTLTSGVDEFAAVGKDLELKCTDRLFSRLFTSLYTRIMARPGEASHAMLRAAKVERDSST